MWNRISKRIQIRWMILAMATFLAIGSPRPIAHSHCDQAFGSNSDFQLHFQLQHAGNLPPAEDVHVHWVVGGSMLDAAIHSASGGYVSNVDEAARESHSIDFGRLVFSELELGYFEWKNFKVEVFPISSLLDSRDVSFLTRFLAARLRC